MAEIGLKIRARREQLGLTQDDLAKKLGYSDRSAITRIEKGDNDINQTKIVAFAKALNTTPAYLMGWEDESPEVNEENFPVSFETFSNMLASHGVSEKDIAALSPDDQDKLFDLIKQFIKSFKKD